MNLYVYKVITPCKFFIRVFKFDCGCENNSLVNDVPYGLH